jgi:hypothetical protein
MGLNELNIKNVESKAVYYKDAAECWDTLFVGQEVSWSVLCHTAKLEPNQRDSVTWLTCELAVCDPERGLKIETLQRRLS